MITVCELTGHDWSYEVTPSGDMVRTCAREACHEIEKA